MNYFYDYMDWYFIYSQINKCLIYSYVDFILIIEIKRSTYEKWSNFPHLHLYDFDSFLSYKFLKNWFFYCKIKFYNILHRWNTHTSIMINISLKYDLKRFFGFDRNEWIQLSLVKQIEWIFNYFKICWKSYLWDCTTYIKWVFFFPPRKLCSRYREILISRF